MRKKCMIAGNIRTNALLQLRSIIFGTTIRSGALQDRKLVQAKINGVKVLTPFLGCQPVQRVVTLTLRSNLSAKGERSRGVQSTAIGIDIDDADLH